VQLPVPAALGMGREAEAIDEGGGVGIHESPRLACGRGRLERKTLGGFPEDPEARLVAGVGERCPTDDLRRGPDVRGKPFDK
jgi:hypothetical protein